MQTEINDKDITSVRALHPVCGVLSYERAKQDRRIYYRLLINGRSGGSLTTPQHARMAIAYWRSKGWTQE